MVPCFGLLNAEIISVCCVAKHGGYFSPCYCHCAKYKTAEEPKVYFVSHSQRILSWQGGRDNVAEFTLLRARKQRKQEIRTK